MIVIMIIGILVGILLPGISAALAFAERINCQSNMKSIASAVHTFSASNDGAVVPTIRSSDNATWPVILVQDGLIEAPNTLALFTRGANISTPERNIFQCPGGVDAPGDTPSAVDGPGSGVVQGFWRSGSATYKVDCWYYWNGTIQVADSANAEPTYDVPSAAYGGSQPTYGYRDAIRRPSQTVMLADGYSTDGPFAANGKYRIAGRHAGDRGGRTATNIAYWDGHVDTLQRNLDRTPRVGQEDPIVSRGTDLKSSTAPFFRLSDQY